MKQSVKIANKPPKALKEVKIPSKLPKVLRDEIDDDDLSLAVDMGMDTFAIIEVTGCVDERTMKVKPAVHRLIERAGTYTEYVPRSEEFESSGGHSDELSMLTARGRAPISTSRSRSITTVIAGSISAAYQSSISLFATSRSSSRS